MSNGSNSYLKPRELAQQSINSYEMQKKQNIEKNNLVLESLGVKVRARALFNSNKNGKTASTSEGQRKKAHGDSDEDYIPCEVDEGFNSSSEDNEFSRQQAHRLDNLPTILGSSVEAEPIKKRVRGPTVGKSVVKMIKKSGGNRIPVVVVPEMRAFCGINATRVANEFGVQIRRMCPIEGFAHSWKGVDSTVKEAIMQAIRDKFQITDEDLAEDS